MMKPLYTQSDDRTSLVEEKARKILLLGGNGQVGRKIITRALAQGFEITATASNQFTIPHVENVHRVSLDLLKVDPALLEDHIRGHDVVVFALGPEGFGKTTIYSQGIKKLLEAMENVKVYRLLIVTLDYDNPYGSFLFRTFIIKCIMSKIVKDMQAMELMLKEYSRQVGLVQFTVAKHFRLVNEGLTERYKAVRLGKRHKTAWKFQTSLDDIADFIIRESRENKFMNKYVVVGR